MKVRSGSGGEHHSQAVNLHQSSMSERKDSDH